MRSTLPRRRALLSLAALSTTMLAPLVSRAQQAWPSRGLRVIVPFPPGGATDTSARIVAEQLALRLRQPVVVENKPGAATVIGMEAAAKAAPDGYTLLVTGGGSLSVLPALRNNLPYDVARDFVPITQLVSAPVVIITPAGRPFQKLADVIAAAKARPNGIRYATYGAGSAPHLAGELLASTTGTDLEAIPYKGASESLVALLRGEVDLGFETLSAASAHVKAGRLRILSLNGEQRSSFAPEVPGMGEQGLAAAAMEGFYCMAAPAGTPADITARLAREVQDILKQADVREKLASQFQEPVAQGPEAMAALVKSQTVKYKAVALKAKIELTS